MNLSELSENHHSKKWGSEMKYTVNDSGYCIYIKFSGPIRREDVPTLKNLLYMSVESGKNLIADLRSVRQFHQSAAKLLSKARILLEKEHLNLNLICTDGYILSILSMYDFELLYDTTTSLCSAKNYLDFRL